MNNDNPKRYKYKKLANDCHVVIDLHTNRIYNDYFTDFEAKEWRDYLNANWRKNEQEWIRHEQECSDCKRIERGE